MQLEGAIKFDLNFSAGKPVPLEHIESLNHWRSVLWQHQLVGQDPSRYDGYGFGNVSQRLDHGFIISGSQTGGIQTLQASDYAVVTKYDLTVNRVDAQGVTPPSSESLTHGTIYHQSSDIRVVLHAHSPDIWQATEKLGLSATNAAVPYGTPDMAREVERLFNESAVAKQKIFSMGGHEDGIVAFGNTAEEAGTVLLNTLSMCR